MKLQIFVLFDSTVSSLIKEKIDFYDIFFIRLI